MYWENNMTLIEQMNDWKSAIQLASNINENEPSVYLRAMFLLLDLLVEGQYSQEEHDLAAEKLKEIFDKSNQKFSNNAEFLFFSGIMAYVGEWYFGMESVDPATSMLENAMSIEPNNTLYKWGYYSRIDQRPEKNTDLKLQLSEQLLFNEVSKLDWLKSKGLLGKYVLGTLEGTYEDLKAVKASD
ncbi:hypothetical protein LS482_08495 [Sinomicrobium kalidii]|uniref:hypothetical protein n=1 Tax=Sinomicrobium kalidii TaxID=2900738 RepID=UPI001E2B3CB1|nr:hypothetical protein [Sinomicrobium kalidii]UGU17905.1 hypothetical protein LS482_08495 [Sinomicrobium kalidii]